MHLVIPVTIATAMAADVMRQRCFSVRRGPRRQIDKVLQDTNTIDELMLFIPAFSSTISRASSSNVHFTTEVIFLPIGPRGLSERCH